MKATIWFAAALLVIVFVVGRLLAIPFSSNADRRAIETSGVVAIIVQICAFLLARRPTKTGLGTGWVLGIGMRFVVLVAYGVVAVRILGMPAPVALISLVSFFFVSTLIEPKLLTL
jgi:hypothetical protein